MWEIHGLGRYDRLILEWAVEMAPSDSPRPQGHVLEGHECVFGKMQDCQVYHGG